MSQVAGATVPDPASERAALVGADDPGEAPFSLISPELLRGQEGDDAHPLHVDELLPDGPSSVVPSLPLGDWGSDAVDVPLITDDGLAFPAIDASDLLPVLGLAGVATVMAIGRGICTPSASLLFANVRLLPCYATATTQSVVSSTVARVTPSQERDARVVPSIRDSLGKIAEGIDRVIERPGGDGTATPTGSNLLVRVGTVLGLIYVGFLTVWFWATRLRWRGEQTP
jgi:hypothetical protein